MRPCVPLIVKTAFVLMFWVTSRQFFKEKRDRRRDSTLADIIAPLQITVGSAGSSYLINDGKKTSKFLKKAGDVIKNLLVRLWIWLLVLVIFVCDHRREYDGLPHLLHGPVPILLAGLSIIVQGLGEDHVRLLAVPDLLRHVHPNIDLHISVR